MSLSQRFLVLFFRAATNLIFRIDHAQLERVPMNGSLIIVMNHINILDIPFIYSQLQPRPVHGMVLAERWKNPLLAWGLDACGSIPLERGGTNLETLRRGLATLMQGEMLIIAPEGTRSGDGCLQTGCPGVTLLALKSQAPLLPVGFYGSEHYQANLKRLRRTDFHIVVGRPFNLYTHGEIVTSQRRQQMTVEIMYQLAAILPPAYRGCYSDLSLATQDYLEFL